MENNGRSHAGFADAASHMRCRAAVPVRKRLPSLRKGETAGALRLSRKNGRVVSGLLRQTGRQGRQSCRQRLQHRAGIPAGSPIGTRIGAAGMAGAAAEGAEADDENPVLPGLAVLA